MRTIWIIIVMAMACSGDAGPWLRPDGEGFMSVDSVGSIGRNQGDLKSYNGMFVEFGLTEEATIGLNAGQDQDINRHATVYLRRSIPSPEKNWALAYDVGLGARITAENTVPHLRIGASVGRGQLFEDKTGWAQMDAFALFHAQREHSFKLETTLGKRGQKNWLYIIQALIERSSQNPWTFGITPSISIPTAKHRHLHIGFTANTENGGRYGVKAAFWRQF